MSTQNPSFCEAKPDRLQRLIEALGKLEKFKQSNSTNERDLIVYADYSKSNRDRMTEICEELGLGERLRLFENGKEVVDYFIQAISMSELSQERGIPQCKVAILILEINLPVLTGNEAMAQVIELFNCIEELLLPVTCYLSDPAENVIGQFLTEKE